MKISHSLFLFTAAALLDFSPGSSAAPSKTQHTDPAQLSATVQVLASPEYEGRGPGTPGEARTIAYLIKRFKALGLKPAGADGQWTQPVPLIHTLVDPAATLRIGGEALVNGTDVVMSTVRPAERIAIKAAPLVFVGYGVNAPQAQWDDFKGTDLKGKVAVFLVNDPDFEAVEGEDAYGRFGGRRMTYYGRWTYKFEEAARQGAVAALIVHDTAAAGYGWATVAANGGGENFDIVRSADDPRIALQGWLSHEAADALFKRAGQDLAALRVKARSAAFVPVDLGLVLDIDTPVKVEQIASANVLAQIPGKRFPQETIQFGAHWDAYGRNPKTGEIRPGANDDGLGVAGVLELARQFSKGPRPDRTLVFALWSAEERGLLGSEYYATHPLFPLYKTVANLTIDIVQTAGPAKDVVLVGEGQSDLEDALVAAARAQGRTVTPETFSERGLFFRADHFSLAKRGVPAIQLMALGGANDLVTGGRAAGQQWLNAYMKCYHQPCDAWSADWNLIGAAADIDLFYAMGQRLADSRSWPEWKPASEFGAIRAMTKAARQ
jgi:Zn-dependent M28 family amino/carboxypeptidase